MKRVTKKSLDELALVMPVICEMNQRYYVGGNSGNTGDSGGWGGDSGGYGDSGGWGGDSGGYGDTGTGSSNSGSFGGSGNSSGGSGNSDDPSYLAPPFFDDSGSFYYNQTEACPYWSYLAYKESGTWPGGVVEGRGYIPKQNDVDNNMPSESTGRPWVQDLLNSLVQGGKNGTIDITKIIPVVDSYCTAFKSNITFAYNGVVITGIAVDAVSSSSHSTVDTGYSGTKDVIENGIFKQRNYIFKAWGTSLGVTICVPKSQIENFEKVFMPGF